MHRLGLAAIALAVALTTGCNSTPTAPSNANVAGRWAGTTCDTLRATACVIIVNISQEGTSLTGTWGKTASNGTLTGSVSGRVVSLVMTSPGTPAMPLTLRVFGDQMSGPYANSIIRLSRS